MIKKKPTRHLTDIMFGIWAIAWAVLAIAAHWVLLWPLRLSIAVAALNLWVAFWPVTLPATQKLIHFISIGRIK